MHPKDYKVYPICEDLQAIINLITQKLQLELDNGFKLHQLNINAVEVKLYMSPDIFRDNNGNILKDADNDTILTNNNFSCGYHTDFRFNDDGKQNKNDTACGDHIVAAYTLGASRLLSFAWSKKKQFDEKSKWTRLKDSRNDINLLDRSIWVLDPNDEKPKNCNGYLYKMMHKAQFKQKDGISIAFVFRCVRTTSYFNETNNNWIWERDETIKKYIEKRLKCPTVIHLDRIKTDHYRNGNDVKKIGENIINSLK